MRYLATLRGEKEPTAIELEKLGSGQYRVKLGDREMTVDALTLPHGAVSLLLDQQSYSVELEGEGEAVQVVVRNQRFLVDVADERRVRLRAAMGKLSAAEGKQLVLSPMPGKVVKVLVHQGEEVKEGQGVVVVEAMKMENELKSPKTGKVVELFAQEGAAVEANAKLLAVE